MTTRNLRDGVIILRDGSGTPKELEITLDNGDFSFSETSNIHTIKDRGIIDHFRKGDEEPMNLTFGSKFTEWTSSHASDVTALRDALKKRGNAAEGETNEWMTTSPESCGVHTVELEFRILDPCNPSSYEQFIFSKVHTDDLSFAEGDEHNTLSASTTVLQSEVNSVHV